MPFMNKKIGGTKARFSKVACFQSLNFQPQFWPLRLRKKASFLRKVCHFQRNGAMNQLPSKDSEHTIRALYWKVMFRAVRRAEEIV